MSIIKEYLADVNGADIFAIISLIIFLLVFILMVIHTFSLGKKEIKDYKNLPLENDDPDENDNQ